MEANKHNLYYAWLVVLPAILAYEQLPTERIAEIWESVKAFNAGHTWLSPSEIHRAEALTGLPVPYKGAWTKEIRTAADLKSIRRKTQKNAIYIALASISLGLLHGQFYEKDELRRIFFHVALTLAEMEAGVTTFEMLSEHLMDHGISLSAAPPPVSGIAE